MSKTMGMILAGTGIALAIFLLLWLTDVDVVDGGELPTIDDVGADAGELPEIEVSGGEMPSVDVDGDLGELPEIDVDVADVEVGTKTIEVKVPTVDIEPADAEGDLREVSAEINAGEGDEEAVVAASENDPQ
ncbi:MAG: hypothetical protein KJN99_02090 [Marinicaulis sp.]|nr:hypothetical protein [Marinicaulis sp.]